MKVGDLRGVLEMLCQNVVLGDLTIDEFQSQMGYGKASELLDAYNGCKDMFENFKALFFQSIRVVWLAV